MANFSTSGTEQSWLIGFSKSGFGAQDLILKHPDLFTLAASWDFPADMPSYNSFGSSSADNYGTDTNFQANYRLTQAFVDAHKAPFLTNNRIWIGGYNSFQGDMSDYDALLTSEGILHSDGPSQLMDHSWDGGWVPEALVGLYQESTQIVGRGTTDTLTFDADGGSAVGSLSGLDGTTVTLPSAPTLAGYTFDGWNSAPDGSGTNEDAGATYTLAGSTTLYAQWTPNATDTLSFNAGGGSAVASLSGLDGTTVTLPSAPTLAGFTFAGWNTAIGGLGTTYAAGATYTLSGSTTLYAQWTPNATDTLSFNADGGSAVASLSGLDGTTVTLPSAPILAGYAFTGWNSAMDGTGANENAGATYTLAGSTTLYAQWTSVMPTITGFTPASGPPGTKVVITGMNLGGARK